jgi:hypothetical protein
MSDYRTKQELTEFSREYDLSMKYFPLLYRLREEARFLIWISNGDDSVLVDADGSVPSFKDLRTLESFAEQNGIQLESEPPVIHDLDWVAGWRIAHATEIKCVQALDAWNLFRDVAASVQAKGAEFAKLDRNEPLIYDKLFWGNNLPAMTPEGQSYVPQWTLQETQLLAAVLSAGLDLFESCVRNRM